MTDSIGFKSAFRALTDHDPFPWQEELYQRLLRDDERSSCDIPTGLGKTAVIPAWLIAIASASKEDGSPAIPRRLVYVVNRRTVVDQSTAVVEKMRKRLLEPDHADWAEHGDVLRGLCGRLRQLAATDDLPLAVSTLRGQLADNGEWRSDPARPAIILGTVDMIGSRLLFGGYGLGFKSRPLHAGFLGQDTLIVHDEAHLEPAFQELLVAIQQEQKDGRTPDHWPLRIMELTATSRGQEEPCGLTVEEKNPPDVVPDPPTTPTEVVWRRLKARKMLALTPVRDEKQVVAKMIELALAHKESGKAILVFARKVRAVEDIRKGLTGKHKMPERSVLPLNGTLRGLERDALVKKPVFQRFLPESNRDQDVSPAKGTVYLICTSAGEVGVDISADHLVCDLSTFESMAQRFGRVNRFGDWDDTRIDVVHPTSFGKKGKIEEIDQRRRKTLQLLEQLNGDASPAALADRDQDARLAAFAPTPTILPATDVLFDAWALTTIREKLPGRPPVEPYLHGISDWQPPETHVAWREEVGVVTGDLLNRYSPDDLLEDYPLKPHELLRDATYRVRDRLDEIAAGREQLPVWIIDQRGGVAPVTLGDLVARKPGGKKSDYLVEIANRTVVLPPAAGGLGKDGMMASDAAPSADGSEDVADRWTIKVQRDGIEVDRPCRQRVWDDDPRFDEKTKDMRRVRVPIDTRLDADEQDQEEPAGRRYWHWYVLPRSADDVSSRSAIEPVLWQVHTDDVTSNAKKIVSRTCSK